MRRAALVALALLALAFPVQAGDAQDPEIKDGTGDAGAGNAFADITAAWLNETDTEVVATLQLATLPDQPLGDTFMVQFDAGGASYALGAFRLNLPSITYFYGPWARGRGPGALQFDGHGELRAGSPGTLVFTMPKKAFNGTAGMPLTKLEAVTELCICGNIGPVLLPTQNEVVFDDAQGARDLILRSGAPPGSGEGFVWLNKTAANGTAAPPTSSANPARTPEVALPLVLALGAAAALATRRR